MVLILLSFFKANHGGVKGKLPNKSDNKNDAENVEEEEELNKSDDEDEVQNFY